MPALLTSSGRPGFYFRVLERGRRRRRRRHREGRRGEGADDRRGDQRAALFAPSSARPARSARCRSRRCRPGGARRSRRCCRARRAAAGSGNAGLAPAAAAHPAAPGFRPLAVTAIDRESADVLSLTMQSADGRAVAALRCPGQYVVLRLRRDRRAARPLSQLLALGRPLDRALSHQREGRAERRRRHVPARPRPRGRCARRQRAARKLRPGTRRRPGRAAQRRDRRDAGPGDAARAGGGALDAAGPVAARRARSAAPSLRRRGARA